MFRVPTWLYYLMISVVFFAFCTTSLQPIWIFLERFWVRQVSESDRVYFPILCRTKSGSYAVAPLGAMPPDMEPVLSFDQSNEEQINRDLRKSIEWDSDYRFFEIYKEENGAVFASIESPTLKNSKTKGWYSIENGVIVPERILIYGPGFALFVAPLSFFAGCLGVIVYMLIFRIKKKNNQS